MPPPQPFSRAVCYLTLIGCLKAAEEALGSTEKNWTAINAEQRFLLTEKNKLTHDAELLLSDEEFARIASRDAEVVNKFLEDRGFDLRASDGDLVVASVLDILVKWVKEGELSTVLTQNGTIYDAFLLEDNVETYTSPTHEGAIAKISTQTPTDTVWMTVYSGQTDDAAIFSFINHLDLRPNYRSSGLIAPMISFDVESDLLWAKGLQLDGQAVAEAVQQNIFKMNHKGAHAQSAAAMVLFECMSLPPMVIDRPFLVWVEREGLEGPLFALYADTDCWENPGELD